MPVNANSVISTQIQTYDSALYTSLTDKEDYCYITANALIIAPTTAITIYQPKFQALSDAIVTYLNIDRSGIVSDLLSISVGYKMMNMIYNSDYSQGINLPAAIRFNIDGNNSAIVSAAISAYADYDGTITPSLTALIAAISNADTNETNYIINSLNPAMTSTVKSLANRLLTEDILAVGSISKSQIGNWFYGSAAGELGYKALNTPLNFGLTMPTYIP